MRHTFGHPIHRNTERNRRIADGKRVKLGVNRKGRASSDEEINASFILFAGACIETWNKEREDGTRRCTYYEIFHKEAETPIGQKYLYRYPKVSDELFDKLVKSNFPPQLLAVATSDIIPLNLIVRGERFSDSKNAFAAKVNELAGKSGSEGFDVAREVSDAHFRGDTRGKTKTFTELKRGGDVSQQWSEAAENSYDFDYDAIDRANNWTDPAEKQNESSVRWNPKNIMQGTKIQNIKFHGGWTISRRMASYWRKNCAAEYSRCCNFLLGLLKEPWPRTPSFEEMATAAPLFNALLKKHREQSRQIAPLTRSARR